MERTTHDVALNLEKLLGKEFGFDKKPCGTIFDADLIEAGAFYDDMVLLLAKCSRNDYKKFADEYSQYRLLSMSQIPNFEAIFDEFKSLL